jgi:GNAT superfamily N-acetyltransferase
MIRAAVAEDLPFLLKMICEFIQDERSEISADDKNVIADELKDGMRREGQDIYIATNGDDICIGFISVHWIPIPMIRGQEGYISEILITKKYRGKGTGSDLIAKVQSEAKRRGCRRLMLNNYMGSTAYKRDFYRKRGFVQRTDFANFVQKLK